VPLPCLPDRKGQVYFHHGNWIIRDGAPIALPYPYDPIYVELMPEDTLVIHLSFTDVYMCEDASYLNWYENGELAPWPFPGGVKIAQWGNYRIQVLMFPIIFDKTWHVTFDSGTGMSDMASSNLGGASYDPVDHSIHGTLPIGFHGAYDLQVVSMDGKLLYSTSVEVLIEHPRFVQAVGTLPDGVVVVTMSRTGQRWTRRLLCASTYPR
jgi:hypothetical protein